MRRFRRGGARTAATESELISLLRSKLDMSSALVVPVQDQAMITIQLLQSPEPSEQVAYLRTGLMT
jgi:hypothetical protein